MQLGLSTDSKIKPMGLSYSSRSHQGKWSLPLSLPPYTADIFLVHSFELIYDGAQCSLKSKYFESGQVTPTDSWCIQFVWIQGYNVSVM